MVVTPFLLLAIVEGLVHGGLWPPTVVALVLVVITVKLETSSTGITVLVVMSVVNEVSSVRGLMLVVTLVFSSA